MLTIVRPRAAGTIVPVAAGATAVVSWNARAERGRIELRVHRADGRVSGWLPYVAFAANERSSLSGADDIAAIRTDVIEAFGSIAALEIRSDIPLDALAVSTPVHGPASADTTLVARVLDVPPLSQYLATHPDERGWCSPASLAMLLAYWGVPCGVEDVVEGVFDRAYGGTGNWAFNVAFAGRLGLRAAVVHLAGLDRAAGFIAAGVPLALSIAWERGELPGAPLERSDGHLAVLCGFTAAGAVVNDPAHPGVTTTYDRDALARVWQRHGGIAYAVVPAQRSDDLVRLANA